MFKKMLGLATLALWLVLLVNGTAVMAQDVCVTEYMANLATPTTVTELRQYLEDIRQVLSECDPVSEGAIEIEVQPVADLEDSFEDENGCDVIVFLGQRTARPEIYGLSAGDGRISSFMEMKKPGESTFKGTDRTNDEALDDIVLHIWDDSGMPKGRYEIRYEAFIGADPVILAFEVEHNAEHRVVVSC